MNKNVLKYILAFCLLVGAHQSRVYGTENGLQPLPAAVIPIAVQMSHAALTQGLLITHEFLLARAMMVPSTTNTQEDDHTIKPTWTQFRNNSEFYMDIPRYPCELHKPTKPQKCCTYKPMRTFKKPIARYGNNRNDHNGQREKCRHS